MQLFGRDGVKGADKTQGDNKKQREAAQFRDTAAEVRSPED